MLDESADQFSLTGAALGRCGHKGHCFIRRMSHGLCRPSFAGMLLLALAGASVSADTNVNFEGKLTRPICLSPDGTRLFAVNTADARLSVFDVTHPFNPFLIAEIPV